MIQKGTVADLIVIIPLVLIAAIGIMASFKVIDDFEQKVNDTVDSFDTDATQSAKTGLGTFNIGLSIVLVGAGIGAVALAFLNNAHPAFLVFSVLFLGITITISATFANVFTELINSSLISGISGNFSLFIDVFKRLPWIMAGIGLLIIIVLFGKIRSGGETV